ncbi:MAG: hypothetical protein PHU75_00975 [Candidatus Nanopelagicales bacterium]|nr:hypothetical protein [Candidatus Nanopelagicales bacterium]
MSVLRRVRSARIPAEVREAAGVGAGERVIAWGTNELPDTTHVIATGEALYLQGSRIPWRRVIRASWSEPFLELELHDERGHGQRLRVPISTPRQLPAAVHAQVTANVIVSERFDLPRGGTCLAAARREGRDEISWTVVFDAGVDPDDPQNRADADRALGEWRTALGI